MTSSTAAAPADSMRGPESGARALAALERQQVRSVLLLVFRIIGLAILSAVLCAEVPAARAYRPIIDAASGVLALWPFFTATGHIWARRIAIGRLGAAEERWDAVGRALAPLERGVRARFFDADGEGRFYLALARRATGQRDVARVLFAQVATEVGERTEWGRRAIAEAKDTLGVDA